MSTEQDTLDAADLLELTEAQRKEGQVVSDLVSHLTNDIGQHVKDTRHLSPRVELTGDRTSRELVNTSILAGAILHGFRELAQAIRDTATRRYAGGDGSAP